MGGWGGGGAGLGAGKKVKFFFDKVAEKSYLSKNIFFFFWGGGGGGGGEGGGRGRVSEFLAFSSAVFEENVEVLS